MEIRNLILEKLKKTGEVKVSEIVHETGLSRAYINRFFRELRDDGRIILIGKANRARYVPAEKTRVEAAQTKIKDIHLFLVNRGLEEDIVLADIKKRTGIFSRLPKNVASILDYAFTEMLNNAIEHSGSKKIEIIFKKETGEMRFEVIDRGIGIYRNIMHKTGLTGEMEAIQDLLKGKLTTAPEAHSGEGIFFTSKVGDLFTVHSFDKKIIFNNLLGDIFIRDAKKFAGTKVTFTISPSSTRDLSEVFRAYTDAAFKFSKTKVLVKLYALDTEYISRSQARRIVSGLNKFDHIVLDFNKVETVGQAFADEVFRVWKSGHKKISIEYINANENIEFMIRRAQP